MPGVFQVERAEAANFTKVWTKNGIAISLQDIHLDFATDFANIVLNSFIDKCTRDAMERVRQQEAAKIQLGE